MNINNVSQMFNQKISDINSRIPKKIDINNTFNSLLEQAKLKAPESDSSSEKITNQKSPLDPAEILKTMTATNSYLSSTASLFSSDSSSNNSIFPTSSLNNSINTLQQNLLLKALEQNNKKESE